MMYMSLQLQYTILLLIIHSVKLCLEAHETKGVDFSAGSPHSYRFWGMTGLKWNSCDMMIIQMMMMVMKTSYTWSNFGSPSSLSSYLQNKHPLSVLNEGTYGS